MSTTAQMGPPANSTMFQNSHFYWNLASIRAVIPGVIKDEQLLQPIEPGLAQYPSGSNTFILGEVTAVDSISKTVQVSTYADNGTTSVSYDYLVLATGSTSITPQMPWKASSTYDECLTRLHSTADRIKAASHIVVAGAGATGVELCGEIRFEFPDKQVILLCADDEILSGDSISSAAERELVKLGVTIRKGIRAGDADENRPDGKTAVKLSNGEEIVTDLYLPTIGFVPNTGFLPAEWLNEHKYVHVDELFRVCGVQDVWAAGDVVSKPRAGFLITEAQVSDFPSLPCYSYYW